MRDGYWNRLSGLTVRFIGGLFAQSRSSTRRWNIASAVVQLPTAVTWVFGSWWLVLSRFDFLGLVWFFVLFQAFIPTGLSQSLGMLHAARQSLPPSTATKEAVWWIGRAALSFWIMQGTTYAFLSLFNPAMLLPW